MRRLLALGCCAVCLAFGFIARAAHVHEAADHHEELRGLHLDHAHVGEASGHGHDHHPSDPAGDGEVRVDSGHVDHHEGDVLYLTVPARRSFDAGQRVVPARVVTAATVEPPSPGPVRRDELPDQLRGPPRRGPTPARSPPA